MRINLRGAFERVCMSVSCPVPLSHSIFFNISFLLWCIFLSLFAQLFREIIHNRCLHYVCAHVCKYASLSLAMRSAYRSQSAHLRLWSFGARLLRRARDVIDFVVRLSNSLCLDRITQEHLSAQLLGRNAHARSSFSAQAQAHARARVRIQPSHVGHSMCQVNELAQ